MPASICMGPWGSQAKFDWGRIALRLVVKNKTCEEEAFGEEENTDTVQ